MSIVHLDPGDARVARPTSARLLDDKLRDFATLARPSFVDDDEPGFVFWGVVATGEYVHADRQSPLSVLATRPSAIPTVSVEQGPRR